MKKKIWLTLGASATVMAPVASLVACERVNDDHSLWANKVQPSAVKLDISKMSVENLIERILDILGTRMAKPITELTPSNEKQYKDLYNDYLSKANLSVNTIWLVDGDKSYPLNFTKVIDNMKELKRIAETFTFAQLDKSHSVEVGMETDGVYGTKYTKVMLSMSHAMGLKDFMAMIDPTVKYERKPSQYEIDEGYYAADEMAADIPEIIKHHPYVNVLNGYHEEIWKFVNSDFYKEWIKGQSFVVSKNYSPSLFMGTYREDGTMEIVNEGEAYDKPDAIDKSPETSNFEFSLFYSLVGLKYE